MHVVRSEAKCRLDCSTSICLVHAFGCWKGDEMEREQFAVWLADKLLGAERLDCQYLIGSLEHSSVTCRNEPCGGERLS